MPKLAAALVMIVAAVGPVAAEGFTPDPDINSRDQARELLAEGVREYLTGRPEQAAVRFQDVLKMDPENKLVYEFYLAVGDKRLQAMMELDQLDDVLKELLRRARIYQTGLRHTAEYIDLMISKLEKSEEERVVATNELVAVGPLAVPRLVAKMSDNRQDVFRVYCRIALTKMGYRAVVPLTEALNAKDTRLVESVAMVLADIGDPRPLAKLTQLSQAADTTDTAKRVVANTIAAITRKQGLDAAQLAETKASRTVKKDDKNKSKKKGEESAEPVPEAPSAPLTADALYFLEAMRYFRGDARVQDEVIANESLMWRWNEEEQDAGKKLGFIRVPRYAWNELMAEELLFDGSAHFPQFLAYQPLLAAVLAAQDAEVKKRTAMAKARTVPPQNPDEAAEAIDERAAHLVELNLRVKMFGAAPLYRAVQQSIVSERYEVAVYLMRLLQDKFIAHADQMLPSKDEGLGSDKPGTVLVAALDHADKTVRYAAASALAHLDPKLQFFNSEKVVPLLADAVGEWGMRVVVVDQDYRQRNTARNQLQKQGYLVSSGNNGFELMERLEESPVKDAIIIAGDLLPSLKDEYNGPIDVPEQRAETLVEKLKKDWRAEKTPIFISLPENAEQAAKIQTAFEGKGVAGFIQKPFAGADMKGQIEAALKGGEVPNVNREEAEEVSLRAAAALGAVDPSKSQFALVKAGEALVKTLDARADNLRIAACHALGLAANHGDGGAVKGLINSVTDVYQAQDGKLTPEVRAAFLYAIGQLNPTTDNAVAILKVALKHEDPKVKAAAAEAVGHAITISPELLNTFQVQQRLDARAPGAGKAQ